MKRRDFMTCAASTLLAGCAGRRVGAARKYSSSRISVEVRGYGPDVVLVPGLGSSTDIWEEAVRTVPGYRYHLVQLAGFAGHPSAGNASGPIIASAAEEIARYIRYERLNRPAIVGHSMGGTIAMIVAARHDLVSKLMVVDMLPFLGVMFGPPGTTSESVRATADMLRDQALAATQEARERSVAASMATMVRNEAMRARSIRDALASDREVSARALHELIVTDLRPELPRIKAPVTVLYVRAPNLPLDDRQLDALFSAAYSGVRQVRLIRIQDSYHSIMYDQPARFRQELSAFLETRG